MSSAFPSSSSRSAIRARAWRARAPCALLLLFAPACASQSRLWRISPFTSPATSTSSEPAGGERWNGFPLVWTDGASTALLWPLIDFDARGFAVRPIASKDGPEWDVLFPLAHVDTSTGEGWALNGYSCGGNTGLFPLCNFGPRFGFAGPAWWTKDEGEVSRWGVFPIAWVDARTDEWLVLNGYSIGGHRGLFPIGHVGPGGGYLGPAWWRAGGGGDSAFGMVPLFSAGPLRSVGPAWWTRDDADGGFEWGLFPLVWGEERRDRSGLLAFPLWYHDLSPQHELRVGLLPPTWWESEGERETKVAFPFYARFADGDVALTVVPPFFAGLERQGASHWFTPLANGWRDAASSGLNVYPLYWSSESADAATTMALPLFLWQRRGDERLLLTPLGGRGWDASGSATFTNVLGPLWHRSRGPDSESTAFLWPLFEREHRGESTQTRAFPLLDVTTSPSGHDAFLLAGLARYVADGDERSLRLWPLWSDSRAAQAPDLLFDLTLAARREHGGAWSNRLFPLWSAHGDARHGEASLLLGLGRHATGDAGASWRLLPLASSSSDPEADGVLDELTLFRHERRGESERVRFFPLLSHERSAAGTTTDLLLSLARRRAGAAGTSWRLWPLASATVREADEDLLDRVTLVGARTRDGASHLHVATPLVFDLERDGASWSARVLTLLDFGREERPDAPYQPVADDPSPHAGHERVVRRRHAGLLFDWFLAERRVVEVAGGATREEAHWRIPFLHEYESNGARTEWDALLWSVHSVRTPEAERFSVLGYAYRSERVGETTERDIFPFITCDDGPGSRRVSFLGRLLRFERQGDRTGGHLFFIPWGDA